MKSYRFISLLVTLLLSIVQLSAQTVDVTGTVYDETGKPLKTDIRMELDPTIRIIESDKRLETCSNCGSKVLPIVYGLPTEDDIRLAKQGKIILGGCAIGPANYGCVSCQQTYHVKNP